MMATATDKANELAAENERLKRSESGEKLFDAAERVLSAWERSFDTPTAHSKAQFRAAIGDLYDAVLTVKENSGGVK